MATADQQQSNSRRPGRVVHASTRERGRNPILEGWEDVLKADQQYEAQKSRSVVGGNRYTVYELKRVSSAMFIVLHKALSENNPQFRLCVRCRSPSQIGVNDSLSQYVASQQQPSSSANAQLSSLPGTNQANSALYNMGAGTNDFGSFEDQRVAIVGQRKLEKLRDALYQRVQPVSLCLSICVTCICMFGLSDRPRSRAHGILLLYGIQTE